MSIRIACVGCAHGELDTIYNNIAYHERTTKEKVDLLICCGDFQAVRNSADLVHLHCPDKYKNLNTFHRYYSGEVEAPVLTIFIGGNHESSAFSQELPHGGWVAKNIYYLGFGSVINFGGIRIAGWSGIFKENDYNFYHFEAPPFPQGQRVSAYHVRSIEKFRFSLLEQEGSSVDIFLTHDWPNPITSYGNAQGLIRFKPHFKEDIDNGKLGNPHSFELLRKLRPRFFFAGHMHARFEATVPHENGLETKFLALHKCARQTKIQNYFNVMEVPINGEELSKELRYDPTWLAILKNTQSLEVATKKYAQIPSNPVAWKPTEDQIEEVKKLFNNDFVIPLNFLQTAPPESAIVNQYNRAVNFTLFFRNPQTKDFCEKLQLDDWNEKLCKLHEDILGIPYYATNVSTQPNQATLASKDENQIQLDDDEFGDDDFVLDPSPSTMKRATENNDEEESEAKRAKT